MKFISNLISNVIMVAYGVLMMPLLIFLCVFFPIMTIVDAYNIISTGYTVYGEYITLISGMLMIMYVSLRFRAIRKIYRIFPSLFEALKYLIISSIFIGLGTEILNWSYIEISTMRNVFGIVCFITSLILWRVFVSLYYKKKPISQVMLEDTEKMQNYNEELN